MTFRLLVLKSSRPASQGELNLFFLFFSFHLQVGECQKERSGSGKQGSQGRGDLWVRSQGDQKGGREGGRDGGRVEGPGLSAGRSEKA